MKKVFLFNTHLNNIINSPILFIRYIRDIMSLFKDEPRAVLLWRPHPLTIETIQSMNPGLLLEYQKMVDEFRTMENGIYDKSADLNRAIHMSDAYIGDASSLVSLYQVTGKPMKVNRPLNEYNMCFLSGGLKDDSLYFVPHYLSGLYRYNIPTGEVKHLWHIDTGKGMIPDLFRRTHIYNNTIWFVPQSANELVKLDVEGLVLKRFQLRNDNQYNIQDKFLYSIQIEDVLWLIPANYDSVIKVNLKTEKLEYLKEWPCKGQSNNFRSGAVVKDELWMFPSASSWIVRLNIKTGKMKRTFWEFESGDFSALAFDGKSLWFAPFYKNHIIKWDLETDIKMELNDFPESFLHGGAGFYDICYANHNVWLIPWKANMILKINTTTNIIEEVGCSASILRNMKLFNQDLGRLWSAQVFNDIILITTLNASVVFLLNTVNDEIKIIDLDKKQCDIWPYIQKDLMADEKSFIRCVVDSGYTQDEAREEVREKDSGKKIWKQITKRMVEVQGRERIE